MGDRYGRSDVNEISIGLSIWDMVHRYGILGFIDMIIHHIDMVIPDIHMGIGIMIWEMTVSIWSSSISIWDILSLCSQPTNVSMSPNYLCHLPLTLVHSDRECPGGPGAPGPTFRGQAHIARHVVQRILEPCILS